MNMLAAWFSAGFGAGYSPVAPGTMGTLVGVVLLWLLNMSGIVNPYMLMTLLVAYILIAYIAIRHLPTSWKHDDQRIVSDEVAGLWLTMIWVPINWKTLVVGFVLFRFFDILKPLGIRKLDNWRNDWGVLVDDLLAGVYANICLRLICIVL